MPAGPAVSLQNIFTEEIHIKIDFSLDVLTIASAVCEAAIYAVLPEIELSYDMNILFLCMKKKD